jgi:hypothetical protein
MRPPFPAPVGRRTVVSGLTGGHVLRTCFRIGEVLLESARQSRSRTNVTMELFARIVGTQRAGHRLLVELGDAFHAHPPRLTAEVEVEAAVSPSTAAAASAAAPPADGQLVRCVGRMGVGPDARPRLLLQRVQRVDARDMARTVRIAGAGAMTTEQARRAREWCAAGGRGMGLYGEAMEE